MPYMKIALSCFVREPLKSALFTCKPKTTLHGPPYLMEEISDAHVYVPGLHINQIKLHSDKTEARLSDFDLDLVGMH